MCIIRLILLFGPLTNAQPFSRSILPQQRPIVRPFTHLIRTPQKLVNPLSEHREFRNQAEMKEPEVYVDPVSGVSRTVEQKEKWEGEGPERILNFEVGKNGGETLGKAIRESEWDQVMDIDPERKRNAIGTFFKQLSGVIRIGEPVTDEDLAGATSNLDKLQEGDIAAVKRSDGRWKYAKLIERIDDPSATTEAPAKYDFTYKIPLAETVSDTSSGIFSIFAIVLTCSGVTLVVFRLRRGVLTPRQTPLLHA